jgi:hypothetical protein
VPPGGFVIPYGKLNRFFSFIILASIDHLLHSQHLAFLT